MTLPRPEGLRRIYDALGDETSKRIYRHRLLYSLLGEREEIARLVCESSPAGGALGASKVCYYGAGAGGSWLVRYGRDASFVIDKYKTGTFEGLPVEGLPVISLGDFLSLPDCKEYLIVVTVGKEALRREIAAELDRYGLRYVFGYFGLQYFDLPQLDLRDEHFVDVGALDGETTRYFLDRFEGSRAYVLEPNPKQFEVTEGRLQGYPQAELFPYGAYDRDGTLYFDSSAADAGSASVSEHGDTRIEVRRLDGLLGDRPVTFIKMDIEGSELAALRGAERIVREQRPKLAVCVYHAVNHIWDIPLLLNSWNLDYRFFLRSYNAYTMETVLYATAD